MPTFGLGWRVLFPVYMMNCVLFLPFILIHCTVFKQQFKLRKYITGFAERGRRFVLPHPDHGLSALTQAACQPGKITVTGHKAEPFQIARIQHVHRIDDHS